MSTKPEATEAGTQPVYPPCVEHGVWIPIPRPVPSGPLMLRLKDVDESESQAVKDRGVMTFHLAGCTGHFQDHAPENAVAQAMSKQLADPRCYGGLEKAVPASFFFHL